MDTTSNPTSGDPKDPRHIDLRLVYVEITHLSKTITEFVAQQRNCNQETEVRIRSLEAGQVERRTQVAVLHSEIERLRAKADDDTTMTRIMALVAAVVAAIIGKMLP